ncbi:P-loop containing nucleoside triphosphate hydrolase protein [Multifurca ochricompacta]|uniref:Kinesin-like protein n=1 Tax=Multifurca ochricompacta TaxID=376703 RepID=A0AAD4QNF3_9AGAM|nr:P-loop containing nucleoside triphosphate hydrolase protein [Multifurca ochricompacta]
MVSVQRVKIIARLRPPIPGELSDDGIKITTTDDGLSAICVNNPRDQSQVFRFLFSSCYGHDARQEDIFEADVKPLIDVVYSGATATIFAYGVTSSGKTHTMQGTRSQPGVIPRAVEALFDYKQRMCVHGASVSVSYMEIYRDEVYDLLVDRETAPKLPVRENDAGQVFVANLSSLPIQDVTEFNRLYVTANKQRSVGSTFLNIASSRSHAILTIEIKLPQQNKILTGKINLVDLAGSENNKLTGNDPSRLQESAAINKSLSVLGQVVHALNQGASRIPYRNSKLTRILQDALGGSSVGLLICNLAPGVKFRQDTLNTLNFAVRTRNVENKPVINEKDARPVPKPHFSAPPPPPPKQVPLAVVTPVSGSSRASFVVSRTAASGVTSAAGPSRVPRISAAFHMAEAAPYPRTGKRRESRIGIAQEHYSVNKWTNQEIDDKISKAVEAEVERRLKEKMEEMERQRVADEKERSRKEVAIADTGEDQPHEGGHHNLHSNVLAPLLKRHQDLDNELRQRLQDLERKYDRNKRDGDIVHKLSPMSRKKTGRAYVALARTHSEKCAPKRSQCDIPDIASRGDLQVALDLYRKAETYVPDNIKLKERIIEIEYAVAHGTEFRPSPKRGKGRKARQGTQARGANMKLALNAIPERHDNDDESNEEETIVSLLEAGPTATVTFGMEVVNSPN